MDNPENAVAIVRETHTVSITFAAIPPKEQREHLKNNGYRFENGSWYRSDTDSGFATPERVATYLAL